MHLVNIIEGEKTDEKVSKWQPEAEILGGNQNLAGYFFAGKKNHWNDFKICKYFAGIIFKYIYLANFRFLNIHKNNCLWSIRIHLFFSFSPPNFHL